MKKTMLSLLFSLWGLALIGADEGEVVYMEGLAWIDRDGAEIEVNFGTAVFEGDVIETDRASHVIVEIPGRATVKLRENTVFVFSNLGSEISLNLNRGSAFSRVIKTFEGGYNLSTPSVVAGVRGTEFFVAYGRTIDEQPDVWLCVNSGTVEVAIPETGESVLVEEGKGINIPAGRVLTEPRRYSWTEELNWNMDPSAGAVEDNTELDRAYEDLLDLDYD